MNGSSNADTRGHGPLCSCPLPTGEHLPMHPACCGVVTMAAPRGCSWSKQVSEKQLQAQSEQKRKIQKQGKNMGYLLRILSTCPTTCSSGVSHETCFRGSMQELTKAALYSHRYCSPTSSCTSAVTLRVHCCQAPWLLTQPPPAATRPLTAMHGLSRKVTRQEQRATSRCVLVLLHCCSRSKSAEEKQAFPFFRLL